MTSKVASDLLKSLRATIGLLMDGPISNQLSNAGKYNKYKYIFVDIMPIYF